jgi:hypothetical protein
MAHACSSDKYLNYGNKHFPFIGLIKLYKGAV